MKRRKVLTTTGTLSLLLVTGCTGNGDDDSSTTDRSVESGPTESEESDVPTEEPDEHTEEDRGDDNEYYMREPAAIDQFNDCRDREMREYDNWIENSGRRVIGLAMGLNGTNNCERFSFVEDEYDPETGELTIQLDFSAPDEAEGCDSGCLVGNEIILAYDFKQELPKQIEVYLTRDGGESELASSWPE